MTIICLALVVVVGAVLAADLDQQLHDMADLIENK